MAFSSASIMKGKKYSLGSYEQEQTRVKGEGQEHWQNPNIDDTMDRAHAIIVVYNEHEGSVKEAVNARIKEVLEGKKIRKDAVTHLPFYATCPNYSQLDEQGRMKFVETVKAFLAKKYGEKNIVDMRWHFDETSPHLHCTIVPITPDGRLSCKAIFRPTKSAMLKWQRDYYEEVAKPLGYDQPEFGRSKEKGYTKETVATREQLRAVESDLEGATKQMDEIQAQIASESARLEYLRRSTRDLSQEVDAMAATAASIDRLEGASRRDYGTRCREITFECNSYTTKISRGIEQLRERISAVKQRITEQIKQSFGLDARKRQAMKLSQERAQQARQRMNLASRAQKARELSHSRPIHHSHEQDLDMGMEL